MKTTGVAGFRDYISPLGSGTLFGLQLFHDGFQGWVVMILPSGGFFTLAGWLLLFNRLKERKRAAVGPVAGEVAR